MSQLGIMGFRGQGMDGRKPPRLSYARSYLVSATFTAPYTGDYKFILRGASAGQTLNGSGGFDGGGSGAYVEKTFRLNKGQTAALVVGGAATTVTVAGQRPASAGAGTAAEGGGPGGTASGGDVMYDGSAGAAANGNGVAGLGPGGTAGGGGAGGGAGGVGGAGGYPGTLEFPGEATARIFLFLVGY